LLLVANRIDATKTAMITGTTKNGEVMCIAQAPCYIQNTSRQLLHFDPNAFNSESVGLGPIAGGVNDLADG
jgi:hypothetical protein